MQRVILEKRKKIEEYLKKIDASAKVLLGIINDVLDMSAIESDKLKIGHAVFDLKNLLSGITTIYYSQCKNKKITFELTLTEVVDEFLMGDALRVNQILLNLLSNAYKFTPEGGSIQITVSEKRHKSEEDHKDKAYIQFIVKDTGCGMSEEMQIRLFQPFEQESAKTAMEYGGSGLGLSITKNLVEMMQGTITMQSVQNVGTTFMVELPFDIVQSKGEMTADKFYNIRALVVDDDAIQLIEESYEGGNGYDVCFIDWKMKEMSGLELTSKIRKEYDPDTLIIIVSVYDLSEIQEEAQKVGANMFITKPLFQSTVYNLLMNLSGGKYTMTTADCVQYDFSGKHVLLAEDNRMNQEVAVELLSMVGLTVDCVNNGQEVVEAFQHCAPNQYDVILMDVQMPILDGYEATKKIRQSNHLQAKSIPIYAMTANAFTSDISEAFVCGMNGHITKPIDTKVLYETLEDCFTKGE